MIKRASFLSVLILVSVLELSGFCGEIENNYLEEIQGISIRTEALSNDIFYDKLNNNKALRDCKIANRKNRGWCELMSSKAEAKRHIKIDEFNGLAYKIQDIKMDMSKHYKGRTPNKLKEAFAVMDQEYIDKKEGLLVDGSLDK